MVEAGTEKVPVGAPIATIVHTEEDIALYQAAQETLGKPDTSIHPSTFFSYVHDRRWHRSKLGKIYLFAEVGKCLRFLLDDRLAGFYSKKYATLTPSNLSWKMWMQF